MGGKSSTSTSTVSIPPEVLARYNAVNQRAENVSMQPYKAFGDTAADYVAQINAQQNAGISDINKYASAYQPYLTNARGQTQTGINSINANVGAYKPYFEDATNATNAGMAAANLGNLDINKYLSPYLSEVRDTTATLMNQANNQAQSGALGTAISSGAFGGDRAGIAAANLNQQNQLAMGNTMANIGNQGYQFAATTAQGQQAADLAARQANLERQMYGGAQLASLGSQAQQLGLSGGQAQLAGAQQMAGLGSMAQQLGLAGGQAQLAGAQQMAGLGSQAQQLGLQGAQAKLAAGTLQQQTEQAGKDAMVQRFMQEQGYPFQVAQFLANIAMGTGAASGSSTATTTPRNWLGFAQGGGVSGPRTYSQGTIGGDGYVPAGDLPVGQLMVAEPPQQDQGNGMEDVIKLIASIKGAAHGGVIDQRHGYALDGGVHPTHWNPVTQKYEMEPAPTTGVVAPDAPAATPAPATGVVAPDTAPAPATGVVAPVARRPEPTPSGWDTFRPKVSQRESGNDPNALLGFANREGKQFAGTNLTGMTVDQAIDFAKPGGAYANYSKTQTPDGRVATPMGEFQIVGTTLADAKRSMGLTGDELMTPELQEKIAHHLYDNYGEKPWSASAPTGGLNTNVSTMTDPNQQYEGGVKPYEDRNFIGKFFHNRDGSLNTNAIMSVIGGLAKGAEAQTISPLAGILSGLGGGMETYKQLLKQTPEVTKANIENSDNFQRLYLRAVEGFGYKGTPEEYAREIGYNGPMPYGGGAGMGAAPNIEQRTYKGAVLDPFGRGLTQEIELPNVGRVQAGQVYGYLKNLEAEMQRSQSLGITVDPQALADLRAKITAHTGQIQTENGPVEDPTYTEALFGAGATVRDAELSNTIALGINDSLTASREAVRNTDELAMALETMPSTGPLSRWIAGAQGIAGQIGLTDDMTYTTALEISGKAIAEQARAAVASLAGTADTSMVRELVEQSTPSGTMTPKAIEELLAIRAGVAAYNEAYNQVAADALAQDPAANVAEVQRKFAHDNKPTDYIEDMRPKYKGMFVPESASALGITQEEWRNLPAAKRQAFLN